MSDPVPDPPADRPKLIRWHEAAFLGALTVLPLLAGGWGRLNADTKQYLYLDPLDLLNRARTVWDSRVGGGAVTHQAIGYLWPMGPYFALTDAVGLPDWAAQRVWVGALQLVAALGALALFRHLLPRSWVHVPAAAAYGLSPFVLGHVTSQSGLLVPFAGLGWLILVLAKAVEAPRSWRWPAAFALIVTTCASLNGSSVFFVVLGAALWVPAAVHRGGGGARRDGLRVLVRAGVLTFVTQLWWLVAYGVGGRFNLPILETTETVRTTSSTTSAIEVLRGLGYWFFYGGDSEGPWLGNLAVPYQTSGLLLVVSFSIPIVALASGAALRWRHRAYFTVLIGVGTLLAVGAFPIADPSPAGAAFERLSRQSDLVLSLRNTQRAGALVALGLAGLLAAALTTLHRRHTRAGAGAALVLLVLVAGAIPAQWRSGLLADRFQRGDVPRAWVEAGTHLDEGRGRVLELPGSDFATYRWGATLDPVSVGLTNRPIVARELVPLGGDAGVDLLGALDRSLQEGWFEPASLAPVARLLGASEVLVRNDLEYERYRTARPRAYWPRIQDDDTGLGAVTTFGGPYDNVAGPRRPMIDEIELGFEPGDAVPPQIAIFTVPGGGREPLTTQPIGGGTVVDGDGEGVVSAAAAGLLDAPGALLLGADLARRDDRAVVTDERTRYVITDSNRKRASRWYNLRENAGATEPADQAVVRDDSSDARLRVAGTDVPGTQTVVEWRGVERIWASAYGGPSTLVPEERPSNAFDGDPTTAWRSELIPGGGPRRIGVDIGRAVRADHLTLVQPQDRPGTLTIRRARVTLDDRRPIDVTFEADAAGRPEGVEVALDGDPFERVTVEILDTAPVEGHAGFAEIQIPGVQVDEVVVLPTALVEDLGAAIAEVPLSIVLTRLRANPAEPLRADPEPSIVRALALPAAVTTELTGTARIDPAAADPTLDALLGAGSERWPVRADSTDRLAGDLGARASSTLDGDLTTAWQTPFSELTGQALAFDLAEPVTMTSLDLEVVADGRHSLPTKVRLSGGDGDPLDLEVPAITSPSPGGTQHVSIRLPQPITSSRWRLELVEVDIRSTTDWTTLNPFTLPVGIAEISLPGVPARPAADVDTGCRTDLLRIDGDPVPIRVTGALQTAVRDLGLEVRGCDGLVELGSGPTEVRATPGRFAGLSIDRLVMQTDRWNPTDPAGLPNRPEASTTVARPGHVSGRVTTDGSPFWLLLDESMNSGWELDVEGAKVHGPRPLDSYAAGWLVVPDAPGRLAVTADWAPQRTVELAVLVSVAGIVLCVGLLVWPRRRTVAAALAPAPRVEAVPPTPGWEAVVGAAILAGVFIMPAAAALAGGIVLLSRRWPWLGRAVPVALVAAASAAVTVLQMGSDRAASFGWPARYPWTHRTALLGIIVLLVLALRPGPSDRRR